MSIKIIVPLSTPLIHYRGNVWEGNDENDDYYYYYALRKDDPIFGDFLDSILVEGEDVNEIVLPQGIVDILDREWNDYIIVKEWMDQVKEPYITISITLALGSDNEEPHKKYCNIGYDDISTLSRIIRFPEGWERCVLPSEKERVLHTEVVGRQLVSLDCLDKYHAFTPHTNSSQLGINMDEARNEPVIAIIRRVVASASSGDLESVKIALYGSLYLSVCHTGVGITPSHRMHWDVALDIMKKLFVPSDSIAYNTISTLAGEGNYLSPTIDARWLTWANYSKPVSEFAAPSHLIREMYEASLSAYPDDVDPRDFGLTFGEPSRDPNNSIARIVPSVHHRVMNLLGHYILKLGWLTKWQLECLMEQKKDMWIKYTVSLMDELIGHKGMKRIVTCLNHAIDKKKGRDELINLYILYRDAIQLEISEFSIHSNTDLSVRISDYLRQLMKE